MKSFISSSLLIQFGLINLKELLFLKEKMATGKRKPENKASNETRSAKRPRALLKR